MSGLVTAYQPVSAKDTMQRTVDLAVASYADKHGRAPLVITMRAADAEGVMIPLGVSLQTFDHVAERHVWLSDDGVVIA